MHEYKLGYGAGQGEENSTIPGYEGHEGYFRLEKALTSEHLPHPNDIPEDFPIIDAFIHPITGDLYECIRLDSCECDYWGVFVRRNNE